MCSDERYYRRRLQQELDAARRAITVEAMLRRQTLIASYRKRLAEIEAAREAAFPLDEVA